MPTAATIPESRQISGYGGQAFSRRQGLYGSPNSGYGQQYSGYGSFSPASDRYGSFSSSGYCDNGISIALLLTAALGMGLMLYVLYQKAVATFGGRKKRDSNGDSWLSLELWDAVPSIMTGALEEFEDTISRIGEDGGENDSWISKMFKNFVGPSLGLNDVDNYEMDGLEPPVLDETWGLGDSKYFAPHKDNTNSTETNSTLTSEDKANLRSKRFADEDADFEAKLTANDADEYINSLAGEEKCKVKFWRCMTGVLTGGMHYLSEPEGITGAAKKAMFKMAFSGQLGGFWNALMTIPEARRIKRCMNANDECMTYETIKAEADITLDSNPRLIVNPDFVENKDTSDGAMEFDEETAKKLADEGYGNFF